MSENANLQQVTCSRLERLKLLSFEELAALSEIREEMDGDLKVTTYRDALPDGSLRIVVQTYVHRFLGGGSITAQGFIASSDGARLPVSDEMIWEFL